MATLQQAVNAVGILAILSSLALIVRWVWHKIPHHVSHESAILQRLSEIVVVLTEQNRILQTPNTEMSVQTGTLLEIQNAIQGAANRPDGAGPMLDALVRIENHVSVLPPMARNLGILLEELKAHEGPSHLTVIRALQQDIASSLKFDVVSRIQGDELAVQLKALSVAMEHVSTQIMATTRPSESSGLLHADLQGIIARTDELQLFLSNQDAKKILALDAMVMELEKFAKQQREFQRILFDGGSIQSTDDETGVVEEKIQSMMRKYGIDRAAAKERVLGARVYEPNTGKGMRENA